MKIALLALTLFLSTAAHAAESWQEPEDFRGLKWGATIEEFRQAFPQMPIDKTPSRMGEFIHTFYVKHQSVGSTPAEIVFGFLSDRFASVTLYFHSNSFAAMKEAFRIRYGQASAVKQEKLKTRMNVEYMNEMLEWTGPTLSISLYKYLGKINDGYASIQTHDYVAEFIRTRKKQSQAGAKDL